MSQFDFQPRTDEPAEAPWRPLDRTLWRWVRAHGGSPRLATLAAWTSFADGAGDTALPLLGEDAGRHGLEPLERDALDALRGEPLVGDGAGATPFVLDDAGRLYLRRNYADELAVAALVHQRLRGGPSGTPADAALDVLFHGERGEAVRRQREAVEGVVGRRLFVLTGGPGTGKTTTVLRMLLMLQQQATQALRIAVAAPTGKAAQRLLQSLRAGKQGLLEHPRTPLPAAWLPLLERIPDTEALTLHRLLGYSPHGNRFTRDRGHPLAADVVVVDEASMVDLGLLRALLEAVRPEATLILVGDADQLTSVAAGSVLMDLVGVLEAERSPALVRLEHSFRAERPLVALNRAVRAGDVAALESSFGAQVLAQPVAGGASLRHALEAWADALAALPIRPGVPAADEGPAAPAQAPAVLGALHALGGRQLLCALREGEFGALAANALIEQRLKRRWNVAADRVWYPGRAVLITRNDYASRLFNGDVGLCLADADGRLRVWFESTGGDGAAGARSFSPGALPAHEGAFAITIHKSQGSEYARVAVLLPPDPTHRILSRQLLYTGVSRARRVVELWAGEATLHAALARPIRRAGGLADRLAGVTPGTPQQLSLL
ncbi:MAG TPA: exodeoxyribonuclease V subunit alpha [Frateuria sp.]|uniref:exodeoxyribonuclease V subunit alpha n=1 Tax=Frateuria sp. TaxID=2211372 RepID=UPI002D8036D4|nr:exodeoxyribonuclease V subunit alpha [Frateuria sp.]HET6805821.1 exodeoxyribonuclease V subunit alpha [Frateuria sp.]